MSLPSGWERSQTLKGIPYYINHRTENTFWNHPLISKVEKDMVSLNYIKYAAYRTAAKLRTIQKLTAASSLDLTIVKEYLEMHGLGSTSSLNQMITVGELKKMLDDIFVYQARQSRNFVRDPSEAAELTLNWILNVFNGKRLENVQVLSIKLALTVLCSGTPQYKYQYLFSQFQNRAGFMERERLGNFLKVCLQIPKYLNEQASFRNDSIEPAIRNCLEQSRIPGRAFQEDFVNWMLTEPQPLVWIPTLYRMAASETSKHEAKCNICKLFPIVGFRYKCVQCFNFDLCQDCFWTGRTSKGHNLGHPIQEYCLASTQKEDTKDFVKVLKNKLMNSKKEERRKNSNERYNPIPPDERQGNGKEYDADDDSIYQPISEYGSVDYQLRLDKSSNQRSEKEPSSWQPNGYPQPPKRYPSKGSLRSSRSSKEDYSVLQRRPPEDPISSPMRDDQRAVLEHIITTLEDDNRLMRQELQSVRKQQDEQSRPDDNPLSLEVKALKNEKQKMQSRQQMLEDHNRKLELQLQKLRMLLQQEQRQVNSMLEEEILQTCKRGSERSESNGSLQLPKNSTTATVMTNSHQNTVSGIDTRLDTPFLPLRSPYISPRSSEFYIPVQITSPEAVFPSSEAYRQEIKQGRGKLPSLTVRNASVKTSMPSPYHQFSWEESHTGDVDRLYRVEKVSEGMGRDVSARKASKEWEKSLEEEELEETVRWAMENFPSSSRCLSSPTKSLSNAAEGLSHSIEEIIATIDDSSSDTG